MAQERFSEIQHPDYQGEEFDLPRLNIAVYSMGNHLADIAGQLMVDRRLANSKISIFSGGIAAAINYYKNALTPDLLVIEVDEDLNEMMNGLYQLSSVCDQDTKVIVSGRLNDIDLYRELIRHGISEYLVLPTTPTGLISCISNIFQDFDDVPLAPCVSFVGAIGGAGTSMIAQSVALNLANNYNIETIFTDLDSACPMSSLSWSINPGKNLDNMLENAQGAVDDTMLKSCLIKISNTLSLLTSPSNPLIDWESGDADTLIDCIKAVRRLSDYAIIDIPFGRLTVEKKVALLNSSDVVIVTEPTIKGVRNLSVMYDVIKKLRPNDAPPRVILNKCAMPEVTQIDENIIQENIGVNPDLTIKYIPEVIELAITRGVPVSSISGSASFVDDIQNCTDLILGKAVFKPREQAGLQKILNSIQKVLRF